MVLALQAMVVAAAAWSGACVAEQLQSHQRKIPVVMAVIGLLGARAVHDIAKNEAKPHVEVHASRT
jgi:hypothetical protein